MKQPYLTISAYVGRGRGRTQVSLAKAIGISEPYLSEMIAGDKPVPQDTAIAIADALGLPISAVIDDPAKAREWQLIRNYRAGSPDQQRALETLGDALDSSQRSVERPSE